MAHWRVAGLTQAMLDHHLAGYCPGVAVSDADMPRAVALANLARFKVMQLPSARLSASGMGQLKQIEGLLGLNLNGAMIDSAAVPVLGELFTLQSLSVANTLLQDYEFHFLSHLPMLRKLDVSNTRFSDYSLGFIDPHLLEELDMSSTEVTPASLERMARWASLRVLRVEHMHFPVSALEALSTHRRVQVHW